MELAEKGGWGEKEETPITNRKERLFDLSNASKVKGDCGGEAGGRSSTAKAGKSHLFMAHKRRKRKKWGGDRDNIKIERLFDNTMKSPKAARLEIC